MTSLRHLRSSTANKRPDPAAMVDGQLAMNYDIASPGLFFKDDNGTLIKVGPVHVGTTAPNVSPAAGGTAGNSIGEQWLDTTSGVYVLKVWDGSAWRSESGTFVDVSGDTMTGALTMANQEAVRFSETTANGSNYIALQATAALASNKTITLPDTTGTVVTTGDTGTVTSTMIANDTILNADVNASAAIAGSKISPDFGSQTVATTGILSTGTGSAAAPSITFTGDTNTGIYSPGADQLAVSTGGAGRLFVDASGRLLVGVSSASGGYVNNNSLVHVQAENASAGITIHRPTTFSALAAPYLVFSRSRGTPAVIVNSGDNLGSIEWGGADGTDVESIAAAIKAEVDGTPGTNDMPGRLTFSTTADGASSPTERLRIDSSGRVGIGTSSPGSKLVVQSDSADTTFSAPFTNYGAILRNDNQTNNNHIGFSLNTRNTSGGDSTIACVAAQCTTRTSGAVAGHLAFFTEGGSGVTERMRIASDGNVFLNTTSNPLPTNSVSALNIVSDGAATRDVISIKHTKNGNNSINIWQTGATSFNALAFYKGDVQTSVGAIVVSTTATAYNTSSDYRIKENVVPLTGAIDRLNNLQVHRFNFVANPNLTVDGFIAHEAQAVVPECVTGEKDEVDDDDNPIYQGIDQSKLVPLLTAALQEAIARIETLEAAVAALQSA